MILRPELEEKDWEIEYNRRKDKAQRVMDRFGIGRPRCGFSIGEGWIPPVERAFEKMIAAGWDGKLSQVKQKFCQLRIYIDFGGYDDVDNPARKLVREIVHRTACLFSYKNPVTRKISSLLFKLRDSKLLSKWRLNDVGRAVDQAESECDDLCERCGKERETKGFGWGMALCNACGTPNERR